MSREKNVYIKKEALENVLKENGYTMKDLAHMLDRNYQSFWRSIKQGKVTTGTLYDIADLLNISVKYLQGKRTVMHSRAIDMLAGTHPMDVVDIALRRQGQDIKKFKKREKETIYEGINEFMKMFLFEFRDIDYVPNSISWGEGRSCKMTLTITEHSDDGDFTVSIQSSDLISKNQS